MIAELKHPRPFSVPSTGQRARLPLRAQAALLFSALAALYWVTATHTNTFDAVAYANQIGLAAQTGTVRALFHPHHLLFNALGYGVWRLARAGGYGGGPLIVLQRINAVVGAAGVTLAFLALRRLVPRRIAWVATALLALSSGWWICATDGRVNMISAVLLLAAFALLLSPAARADAGTGGGVRDGFGRGGAVPRECGAVRRGRPRRHDAVARSPAAVAGACCSATAARGRRPCCCRMPLSPGCACTCTPCPPCGTGPARMPSRASGGIFMWGATCVWTCSRCVTRCSWSRRGGRRWG